MRFRNAEEADLAPNGAVEFQRQLVKGNLSVEYAHEIRLLLEKID
jgi:hypothetical protein